MVLAKAASTWLYGKNIDFKTYVVTRRLGEIFRNHKNMMKYILGEGEEFLMYGGSGLDGASQI